MPELRSVLLLLFGCVACSSPSPAPPPAPPSPRPVRLSGTVTDPGGAAVSGARVAAGGKTAQSGADGRFTLEGVPEGTQLVTATASGRHTEVVCVRALPGETRVELSLAPSAGSVEIAIAGDVAFTGRDLTPPAGREGYAAAYAAAAPLLAGADLAIVNLESVISAEPGAAHPTRPRLLLSPPDSVAALTTLGVDVVLLANDHLYDYLDDGVLDTLEALRGASLTPLGAGAGAEEAYTPVVLLRNGVRVGLVAVSALTGRAEETQQHEPPFFDATGKKAGVARLDVSRLQTTLTDLRGRADRIVVVIHGGHERDDTPSSEVATAARRAIEAGADLVVAHHPRAPGGIELYRDHLVVYSLGALAYQDDYEEGVHGAVLRVRFPRSGPPSRIVLDPVYLDGIVPGAAAGPLGRATIERIAERSAPLGVTVVQDGERARVLPVAPGTLPATDRTGDLDLPATTGEGASHSFELEPGQYLTTVAVTFPTASTLWLGRDLLGVGDFEDLTADGAFASPAGWRLPSDAEQLVAGNAASGQLALSICRSGSARSTASAESRARFSLEDSATVSLCGCWRGDRGTTGAAKVVFWGSLDEDARSLETRPITDGKPPAEWGCFCRAAVGPPGSRFASVLLEHTPTADHTACVSFDSLRLVEWTAQDAASVTLSAPNRVTDARVTGVGSAPTARLSYTLRTLQVPH